MNKFIVLSNLFFSLFLTSIQAQTFFDNLQTESDIQSAMAILESNNEEGTLFFNKGACILSTDGFEFPEYVTLEFSKGSYLTANSTINIFIDGATIKAGQQRIFSDNIKFDTQFSKFVEEKPYSPLTYKTPKTFRVLPQWFGPNNSTSVNKAMRFAFFSSKDVHLPAGTYTTNDVGIFFQPGVSVIGDGYNTVLKKGNFSGPVVQYDLTDTRNYNYNIRLENFCITGGPTTVEKDGPSTVTNIIDPAVDGIILNPYWGFDGCIIENIMITDCGGWGLKITPNEANDEIHNGLSMASAMVMQHCAFTNVVIQSCGNGVLTGGFIAQTQFNSCEFEFLYNEDGFGKGFETFNINGRGPQDLTFINCTFHLCREGVHSYASRNMIFLGCHFEGCSKYAFYTSSQNDETPIGFYNSSFTSESGCDYPIYIEENGKVNLSIYNNIFKGGNSAFVKMPSQQSCWILVGANNKAVTFPGNGYIENSHNVQGLDPFESGQIHLNTISSGNLGIDINRYGDKVAFLGSETNEHAFKGLMELYHDEDIYDPTDDPKVRISAAGDSYIATGNVGIGTDQPSSKLHVKNGDLKIENDLGGIEISNSNGISEILSYDRYTSTYKDIKYDASKHNWRVGGNQKMELNSSELILFSPLHLFQYPIVFNKTDMQRYVPVKVNRATFYLKLYQ